MIVLVWSLISSVTSALSRKRLAVFLRHFHADPANRKSMLVCKRIRPGESLLSPSPSSGRLTRFTSEPQLHTQQLIYRTQRAELAVEPTLTLLASEWRFVDLLNSSDDEKVFFVASIGRLQPDDEPPMKAIFLESCCDRIAWHKLQPASLYSCNIEQFVDIVYAFSEGALFENNTSALVESIHTIFPDTTSKTDLSLSPAHSLNSNSSSVLTLTKTSQKRPMPLLEQLFWGDGTETSNRAAIRYGSETTLNNGHYGSLPRRSYVSPRRRYRSCTSSTRSSKELYTDFGSPVYRFFDPANHLPPFLKNLNKEKAYIYNNGNLMEQQSSARSIASSGISPSVTIEGIDIAQMEEDDIRSITELPYVDDSTVTSPLAITDGISSYAALVYQEKRTASPERAELSNEQKHEANGGQQLTNGSLSNGHLPHDNPLEEKIKEAESVQVPVHVVASKPPSKPPTNGSLRNQRRTEQHSCPPPSSINRRRHSAMVQSLADTTFNFTDSSRHRSISPMPGDHTLNGRRRSLRNSIFSAQKNLTQSRYANLRSEPTIILRGVYALTMLVCTRILRNAVLFAAYSGSAELSRPYTPSRRFYCHRTSVTDKTMNKPPSILVYTGDLNFENKEQYDKQKDLFNRIRYGLSRVLPSDRYTVFNISAKAVKHQPWIEKTTACLLIACTDGLDDTAWSKMQAYFNQAGKIIFVCQNRLLASLTNCESSKKQADILRMTLGHNHSSGMGKDFETFLKKSLKILNKHGVVNETFRSKDLTGEANYSVVLTKTKETPMLLYMENSAHQAAAMFSDATPDQLLAPGSKILRDSLSRVGVLIHEHEIPNTSTGILVEQEDDLISSIQGMRFGENIGKMPKLFLRVEETVKTQGLPSASRELLPIQVGCRNTAKYFDFDFQRYFARLDTPHLGRICLHVPVTTSTMDVMSSLKDAVPCLDGAVVIAGQQVQGQGRGGNEFISPQGAAMFTFSAEVSKKSTIAQKPGFIQHILAVALVDAVHTLSGMPDFPLRIKWPNDFYYNRSHKLGGMLAQASFRDDCISFILGAGINVTNSQPTVCLNDIIPEENEVKFTVEDVIAETLNKFQMWLNRYEYKGQAEILNKYYEFWLHDREEVLLEESGEKVVIRGLDENGYLQVRSKRNPGKLISLMENDNTFDMMKGLIRQKF